MHTEQAEVRRRITSKVGAWIMVSQIMTNEVPLPRKPPAVILTSKEPTQNIGMGQLMKPVKLTRKKSPSPVKFASTDEILDNTKDINQHNKKQEPQPVATNNILLIQRNQNSFRTTGPDLSVMRTVTKPVILPMVGPATVKTMKRKVLSPILSEKTKKIFLTDQRQMSEKNSNIKETITESETAVKGKSIILQSKDLSEVTTEPAAVKSSEMKVDHGEPINLSLKVSKESNTGKPVPVALIQNSKVESNKDPVKISTMALPYDYNRCNRITNKNLQPKFKVENQSFLSNYHTEVKSSEPYAIDTSSKIYKALTGKILSRFIPQTRLTFSTPNSIESVLTPSESMLQHSVSITPIRRSIDVSECSEESGEELEQCHICKMYYTPEAFLTHNINACFEAKRSQRSKECRKCGKYYSDKVELDRHKCDGFADRTKKIRQVEENRASDHDFIAHNDVDVKQELIEEDPLNIGDESPEQIVDGDIDDDEESYLQKIGEDMANLVQVKLECNLDEKESIILDDEEITLSENMRICPNCQSEVDNGSYLQHVSTCTKKTFACLKCPRTYSAKQLCDLHMKKAHNVAKFKEKCEICGVRFINLQAHKEKYHYFVDVDKCSLCGKVKLLESKLSSIVNNFC